ncbi:MAG: pyridoxamine 5'-phosphate oxidase family protein [Desulfatitalea sp.]|nr:pyridoxamine 5'-phosphate oxidase family protein [Desulfatitalea sp.]
MLEKIKTLIRENDICVLATGGAEGPHTSLMAYICSEAATDIYLVTPSKSLKYRNIIQNGRVSLLVDTRDKDSRGTIRALTINGQARVVLDEREKNTMLQVFARRHSHLTDLLEQVDIALVRIQVRSLQLLNGPQEAHHILLPEEGERV